MTVCAVRCATPTRLAENWKEVTASDGSVYFYNTLTDESTRKHPLEDYYSALYLRVKNQGAGIITQTDHSAQP